MKKPLRLEFWALSNMKEKGQESSANVEKPNKSNFKRNTKKQKQQ